MQQKWREHVTQGVAVFARAIPPWAISVVATFLVLIAYFLSARLGLALLTQPDGVAVFWPAAGVSAGLLVGLGQQGRLPVVIGVGTATIAANLLGDRNIPSSIVFAACNAFEAVLVAGLIERYFGFPFRLDTLQRVIGLTTAAILGCATSGVGGAVGYSLFHKSTASALTIWYHWFGSDAIGIVTIAPFVIGLVAAVRDLPSFREMVEGAVALTMLALANLLLVAMHRAPWDDVALVLIFPMLLWIAARCRPYFAAAAAFIVALTIVWLTTFEVGSFGDQSIAINDRILHAQVIMLTFSLSVLLLAALFSERRRHESQLAESEIQLQEALKAGQASTFDWDVRSDLSQRSENAVQILGLDPKREVSADSFFDRVHPDDRTRVKTGLLALRPDNPSYVTSFRYVRSEGQKMWLEVNTKAQFDAAGQIVRIRGLAQDITERKRIDDDLAEARKTAEQANRAKSAFLAAASHDLRQPLQTLKILQGTLLERIQDSAARPSIIAIGRSLETMSEMLASLLDINQLEAGTIRPVQSDFSVNDMFDSLAADFADALKQKGLQCRFIRSGLTLRSDRRMLQEIIRNLLSNAIRYTEKGRILVGCRRAGHNVRIELWDSGVGIMGEHLPKIFDEYFQGPQTEPGGFGLGLAIVQRLGNILRHQIGVRSTPGKGSVFSITVPIGRVSSLAGLVPSLLPVRPDSVGSHTILAIEDEGSVRTALERWLRSQGLDVVSVSNGSEALALVNAGGKRFDLILSDYNIPGQMNGIDSVRALRAALARKVPAIVLTGDIRSGVIESLAKHDVGVAIKPIKMDDLMALIKSQLTK